MHGTNEFLLDRDLSLSNFIGKEFAGLNYIKYFKSFHNIHLLVLLNPFSFSHPLSQKRPTSYYCMWWGAVQRGWLTSLWMMPYHSTFTMLQWVVHVVDSHTPGVALPSFAVDPLGMAQGYCHPGRVWRAGIWHVLSGRALEGLIKNETGPLILRVIFGGCKKRRLKTIGDPYSRIFSNVKFWWFYYVFFIHY